MTQMDLFETQLSLFDAPALAAPASPALPAGPPPEAVRVSGWIRWWPNWQQTEREGVPVINKINCSDSSYVERSWLLRPGYTERILPNKIRWIITPAGALMMMCDAVKSGIAREVSA